MKTDIYIFGKFADGYSQYPEDNHTHDIFETLGKQRRAATELVYHREGALAYYIYMREISRAENTYIGLCYVFNDVLIRDFSYLFSIFEDAITNTVVKGELLEFTNDGNLSTKVGQLYTKSAELQRLSDYLNSKLSSIGQYAEKLPPANFSVSNTEWKTFSYDNSLDVQSVIKHYSNIRIIKDGNYDTESLKGYAAKLKNQNNQIKQLSQQIVTLKNEKATLQRQKKQITVVVILIILIAIGLIIFISKINSQNELIKRKDKKIENLSVHRMRLQKDSINLLKNLNNTKESLQTTINSLNQLRLDYSNLEKEKNDLSNLADSQRQTINRLENTNNELIRNNNHNTQLIAELRKQISELENTSANLKNKNSSYSSYTYNAGGQTRSTVSGFDNGYAQWLYTTKALKINSFYVCPDKSGYITIGLYTSSGSCIATYQAYVTEKKWNQVYPDFELNSYTKYYLAIKESNGINLGYHSSNDSEYNNYKSGYLQLIGSCSKGSSDYGTKYYQYFYNINYSIKN